ncbi:MAG: hypothetical protein K2G03_01045, partial [Bacilli bacterium]|nr:hypothetical protein [Bacilli bacterium]
VYSWLLTTCENDKLYFYRNQLMQWALMCPYEYIKLFDLVIKTNDLQMKEILVSIIMCLFFENLEKDDITTEIMDVLEKNLYDQDKNLIDMDLAIRYYLYSILKKAKSCNIISDKEYLMYIPKKNASRMLDIDKDKLDGSSFNGLYPIIYDWSRYVLCDPFNNLFAKLDEEQDLIDLEDSDFSHYTNTELEKLLISEELDVEERERIWKHLENNRQIYNFDLGDEGLAIFTNSQ